MPKYIGRTPATRHQVNMMFWTACRLVMLGEILVACGARSAALGDLQGDSRPSNETTSVTTSAGPGGTDSVPALGSGLTDTLTLDPAPEPSDLEPGSPAPAELPPAPNNTPQPEPPRPATEFDFAKLGEHRSVVPVRPGLPDTPPDYVRPFATGYVPWRESRERFCDPNAPYEVRLWADNDGIAALSRVPGGFDLRYNAGNGWRWLTGYLGGTGVDLIAGYPSGKRLVLGGNGLLTDVALDGSLGASAYISSGSPDAIVGVAPDLVFATVIQGARGSGLTSIHQGNGGGWLEVPVSAESRALLAADSQRAYVAGHRVWQRQGQELVEIYGWDNANRGLVSNLALLSDGTLLVFARGSAESTDPVDAYDGNEWTQLGTTPQPTVEVWSDGTQVYYIASQYFGRVSGAGSEVLLDLTAYPGWSFQSVTGVVGEGVFVAVKDERLEGFACGSVMLFRFDGATFHQL